MLLVIFWNRKRMKGIVFIAIVILITSSVSLFGQSIDYRTWNEESKSNIRLLPEYGNIAKTNEQRKADDEFIKASVAQDGTREKASAHMVELGFNYLNRKDLKTAMYRFNQAWLLNPKNEEAYWGFGAVYLTFDDLDRAMSQYAKGLAINPKNSNILTDKATVYLARFNKSAGKQELDSAISIFQRSYQIDPKNQNTLYKLSVCYFLSDNCKDAVKYHDECTALGGRPLRQEYTDALKTKCK